MKLPEQIPDELVELLKQRFNLEMREFCALAEVYEATAEYFNNLPTEWYPVSEKPEDEGQIVWVTDGDLVELTSYCSSVGFMASTINESNITHWTHVKSDRPEPPKE